MTVKQVIDVNVVNLSVNKIVVMDDNAQGFCNGTVPEWVQCDDPRDIEAKQKVETMRVVSYSVRCADTLFILVKSEEF